MKRTAKSGLIPAPTNLAGGIHRRVFNKVAPAPGDWFRIENKKSDDDEDVTKVYIYDEIGFWGTTAADFVKQLLAIDTAEIELHLNSPGGNVFDGIAIYNGLKMHAAKVTVIVDALAASAASFIAQAGDEVVMTRNATMMIHDASGMAFGNADEMRELADVLDKLSNNIADIYAYNAGGTVPEWRALMKEEVWYSAQEAVDAGLASSMLDAEDATAEQAKNKWDLSIFNHTGREQAPSPEEVRKQVLVTNQLKEAPMAKATATNTADPAEGTQPDSQPAADPQAPAAPAAPEGAPEAPESTPASGTEDGTAEQTPESGGDPASSQPSNSAAGFQVVVNGVPTTDPRAIQAHIAALETFRTEAVANARKTFVTDLARQNKLAATAVDKTTEFVLGLSDKQYEDWTATWDGAGSIPMFGSHGQGGTGEAAPSEAQAQADQIEIYKATVQHHKNGGMPIEKIKETGSYQNLIALVPDFKL
jgi:ATP-dependent protease ClpP protease subunit